MPQHPIRIHKDCLPKKLGIKGDSDGFIYGYWLFDERDYKAVFMNSEKAIFECSRPILLTHTHLLMRYNAVVYTGYDKGKNLIGELCELTCFFNL